MKQRNKISTVSMTWKYAIITALYTVSALIAISGAWFVVYSIINDISIKVISSNVPGFVFGILAAYLGIRYFLLVGKLRNELLKPTTVFSWSNFKKAKKAKSR